MAAKKKIQEEVKVVKAAIESLEKDDKKSAADKKEKLEVADAQKADVVSAQLAKLEIGILHQIQSIGTEIRQAVNRLDAVKEAIVLKQQELDSLYGKEITARALEELIAEYEQKKLDLQVEERELQAALAKSRKEQEEAFAEWSKQLQKQRAQEQEDYSYKLSLARRNDKDAFEAEKRANLEKETARKREFEESLRESERALAAKQEQLSVREVALNKFEAEVKAAVEKELVDLNAKLTSKYENEIRFLRQDFESKLNIERLTVRSLSDKATADADTIANLNAQISVLQTKLTEMAMNSIAAVGNAKAINDLKEVAKSTSSKS